MDAPKSITRPDYYKQAGGRELIDSMVDIFGYEDARVFCLLNAQKYIARAGKKTQDPTADIDKAIVYLQKYKELFDAKYKNAGL